MTTLGITVIAMPPPTTLAAPLPTPMAVGTLLAPALAAGAIWIAGARVGRARVRDLAVSSPGGVPTLDDPHGVGDFIDPCARAQPVHGRFRVALRAPEARGVAILLGCSALLAVVTGSLVPLVLALPATAYTLRRRARAQVLRAAIDRRAGVTELATAMVGELRAGQAPSEAFTVAAHVLAGPVRTCLTEAVAVARVGGDVPDALVRAAAAPGADALARIAACWRVAAERGAGFAPALDRIAAGLRAEESGHRELEAELSGARTTARLLAALPLVGLVLGQGVGADPLDVLLHTPLGVGCLVLGLILIALGLDWTDRIARDARGPRWTA
ncbi:type II secretion system F family protein [Yinghuangia sp. YIM S09857]|uniref:type II secretion system F family protein n=1 Tax=Yinghuangia sp. YIM S09857 TaxID=3436929 RepID=UPI003F52A614